MNCFDHLGQLGRKLTLCLALGAGLAGSPGWAQTRSMVLPRDPEPRSGQVAGAPEAMAQAVALVVRADAAGLWKRDDHGKGLTLRTEVVTWRDGSLGCPASDRRYSQATVPGWRIIVGDERRTASYHVTRSGKWLLCPPDRIQAPLPADALR
jgi:hypothetical protein